MITWESYFERLVLIQIQFNLAKKAIAGFAASEEALTRYANDELEDIRRLIAESADKKKVDPKGIWVYEAEAVQNYLKGTKDHAVKGLGDVQARLVQYEYILRVAVFESFMKDLHREILSAMPSLLKEDRQVSLGKLISKGQDELVREEIEREVQILDRKSTEEKARYFLDRLGISWFDGTIVPILDTVIRARNEMLHENPERVVSGGELLFLNLSTMAIPVASLAQAALLYPDAFSLPLSMTAEDARKFLPGAKKA